MKTTELITLLRERNKVRMPVSTADGEGVYVMVVKADLEEHLKSLGPKAEAPWGVLSYKDGILTLDPDV